MFDNEKIPPTFLQYATKILGATNGGLSGRVIVDETAAYAAEYDVRLPHPLHPYEASSKRQAPLENLMEFSGPQQYRIIKELCEHNSFSFVPTRDRQELKIRLVTKFPQFAGETRASDINETLIEETRHWLDGHDAALLSYNSALQKYEAGIFHRNLLDDLRLALELLLKELFDNNKLLENQLSTLGSFIKEDVGSIELANMFQKLVEYYGKYQNSYAKHDSVVLEEEIEFIFEITSSFMKHLVHLSTEES